MQAVHAGAGWRRAGQRNIGVIQMIHVRADVINDRHYIDITKLRPIARLAGASYAYVHETFNMVRPVYDSATGKVEPLR
jgi:hypothetical protein